MFTEYWNIVKKGYHDKKNIRGGNFFAKFALDLFEKVTASQNVVIYFLHPDEESYGAHPDALGPADIILEIKVRAKNCLVLYCL